MTASQVNIQRAIERLGSPAAVSRALGISRSHVRRLTTGKQKPGIETTLRIAQINEDDPMRALELSGHGDVAEVLREIFGTPGRDKLTASQRQLLADIESLGDGDRRAIMTLVRSLVRRRRSQETVDEERRHQPRTRGIKR